MFTRFPSFREQDVPLSAVDDSHLVALSHQTNMSHAQLLEMQTAQQAMKEASNKAPINIEVPKVNFYPSRHPNLIKARKQNIRHGYKLLRPAKRSIIDPRRIVGSKYRYNKESNRCVIDGCNCEQLILYDNLYAKICDEENGRSLWEMYWTNPISGEVQAFQAREKVTGGRKMIGTYCPEHLHLYHLLCKWETEEEEEKANTPSRIKQNIKKGVSTIAVPISIIRKPDNTPEMLKKYEPFFQQLETDARNCKGISILHYTNPDSGLNDITMVVFDLRLFHKELQQIEESRLAEALGIDENQPVTGFEKQEDGTYMGINPEQQLQMGLPSE
jgi:hypothetical protein